MERWRQEPSSKHNSHMKEDCARHGDTIQQIQKQTMYLSSKHIGMNLFLSTIKKPMDVIIGEFSSRCVGRQPKRKGSLLDTPIEEEQGMGLLEEQVLVEKIDGILQGLGSLKRERQQTLTELKEMVNSNNID
jgi:hypothetical protein